jgi:3alpha(or 20beta)-hydroxysteroid dehydrogenase
MTGQFDSKVVVITGAAGGIGGAAATRFAREGARVVLVDLAKAPLNDMVNQIESAGGQALAVAADVTCSGDVERYTAAAVQHFGGIDCFFNNAGVEGAVAPLLDYPEEDFDRVIAVNLKGVWLGLQHVGRVMRERHGGVIVNTASIAGLRGGRSQIAAYTASKWAVVGLTRTAALELASYNIRVNAVCPAPVETRMMRSLERGLDPVNPESMHARLAAGIPLGRYARPEEVAGLVAFLCGPEAEYITGGSYPLDGGATA